MKLTKIARTKVRFPGLHVLGLLVFAAGCASGTSEGPALEPEAANPGQLIAAGAEVYGNNCARCHNARAAAEKTDLEWNLIVAHMRARANLTGGQARAVQAFLATVNTPSGGTDSESPREAPQPDPDAGASTKEEENSDFSHQPTLEVTRYRGPFSYETSASVLPPTGGPLREDTRQDLVAKGRTLATGKGCVGCHVMEEKGGTIGPSLDDLFERRNEEFIREKLSNPRADNPNSVMPDYGLTPEEIGAFVAYLRSLGEMEKS